MSFYLNLNAVLRHPLSGEKRREFRRNRNDLPRLLDETRQQLFLANSSLQHALARNDELVRHHDEVARQHEAAFIALRRENAALAERGTTARDLKIADAALVALQTENSALAERAAVAADLTSALTRVEGALTRDLTSALTRVEGALTRVASADTVAAQLSDARDRLASRLELLTLEVSDVRRRVDAPRQQNGSDETRRLYLDLLETALTGVLTRDGNVAPWATKEFDPERRLYGRDWPKSAATMIGTARMRNLRRLVETALVEGVAGDLLEAGVWRGGACIYMRGILSAHGVKNRKVWVADSFTGLPKPDEMAYPADKGDPHHTFEQLRVSLDEVKDNFQRFGLLDEQVAFLPGWFKDTLPQAPIEQLSVLRLDGDMYGSTMETLVAMYPRVSSGGFVIVDDYILPACRQAVDDFREQRGIDEPLHDVDGAAVYWKRA